VAKKIHVHSISICFAIFLIFINFITIPSVTQGIIFHELDENDDQRKAWLIVHNNAGQIIDVKTKEENGTLVYNNMLDSGWVLYQSLKPSTYLIEISPHQGQQEPTESRIVLDGCTSFNVVSEDGVIIAEPQTCIRSVVDSLNKFGSVVNFPDSIDVIR
jgi:hypothetical protein